MTNLFLKRVYEPPDATDGMRVLVDRLWPRGLAKLDGKVDEWLREVAPSPELRRWFGHKPERFAEFRECYRAELTDVAHELAVTRLHEWTAEGTVTLLYSARDILHNHALVLYGFLTEDKGPPD